MHSQIAAGQIGDGPILVRLPNEGDSMRLRGLIMSFVALLKLIDANYRDTASFFHAHDIQRKWNVIRLYPCGDALLA